MSLQALIFKDCLKPHVGCDPFSGDPRAVAPVKGPPLLVKRIASRVRTIGGRRMGKRREGTGDAVPQSRASQGPGNPTTSCYEMPSGDFSFMKPLSELTQTENSAK